MSGELNTIAGPLVQSGGSAHDALWRFWSEIGIKLPSGKMACNQLSSAATPRAHDPARGKRRGLFAVTVWHGMTFSVWLRLLARNRFAVSPRYWLAALSITAVSLVNSCFALLQSLLLGRRMGRTEIREPPIFILGHWRSGTTLVQQLFAEDDRWAFSTAYECFAPKSAQVTAWFVTRWLAFLHPGRRPADNMSAGPNEPHEDEFALCSMGVPSPYAQLAFPNRPQGEEFLDFAGAAPAAVRRWQAGLLRFMRQVTWRAGGKRLVLKSPPHTARVRWLLELFPDARFVHIVRDPRSVFPSTVALWKSLHRVHGLQRPRSECLEEHVYRSFIRMHQAFRRQRGDIPPDNLCEVRYEDLIRDPLGAMRQIYEQLRLGQFECIRPRIEQYFAKRKDYQTNRYELSPQTAAEITRRWGDFLHEYGYSSLNEMRDEHGRRRLAG
jgi:omega-hydroxy-beta-dihydromenaquinone-9 sulfotransferase